MTCAEVRDRLSDLVDERLERADGVEATRPFAGDALDGGMRAEPTLVERARIDEHLAACAECQEEMARLEQTVALLRAVDSPRAPAGFVDRVLEGIRPPWYRRLAHGLLSPLRVKLPLEVAAILLVSAGVVYVVHRTPELQDAARLEPGAPVVSAPQPGTNGDTGSAETGAAPMDRAAPAEPRPHRSEVPADAARDVRPAPTSGVRSRPASPGDPPPARPDTGTQRKEPSESSNVAAEGAPAAPALPSRPSVPPTATGERQTYDAAPARRVGPPQTSADASAPPPAPPASASTATADAQKAMTDGTPSAAAPAPSADTRTPSAAVPPTTVTPGATTAQTAASAPDVRGRLTVSDLEVAERRLRELAERHGGAAAARREDGDAAVVLEFALPARSYVELAHALPSLGRWRVEREASPRSDLVRLEIRLER